MCGGKGSGFFCWIAKLILIIGGLNWGAIGIFDYNFVANILGQWPIAVRIVYIVVGVVALLAILCLFRTCKCKPCSPQS